jgi:NADH dehydrogenase/NADH:ubiquinone oxidoreductase subunit G
VKTVIMQDCFGSPLWERADYQIPGATFAEREGSYVNFNDRLQSFQWAIRPPAGVLTEGQLYWQLLKKPGLYKAASVLGDVTREIAYFSAATEGVPGVGVDLKVNKIAEPATQVMATA